MKAIIQRVLSASVKVDQDVISSIGRGILVFAAVAPEDTVREIDGMAAKVLRMKLWPDDNGANWKKSVADIQGDVLCGAFSAAYVLGSKPDFHGAAGGEHARSLYECFVTKVKDSYEVGEVKDGLFQAMMEVSLVNDGPVTLELEVNPPKQQLKPKGDSKQQDLDAKAHNTL